MGQKSLSMLHRADCSMIWNSFLFDKHYKWLSYNLWFTYIQFYKVIFFFDFTVRENLFFLNHYYRKSYFLTYLKKDYKMTKTTPRFSYYTDLYCLEVFNQLILLNLYFYTTLEFYKKKKNIKKQVISKTLIWDDYRKESFLPHSSEELYTKHKYLYENFF